jgi:murein DD-endopeptidase MepM/ murein hydrolase activator NlpD
MVKDGYKQKVIDTILSIQDELSPVLELDLNSPNIFAFDLTENNSELRKVDLLNTQAFEKYIFDQMKIKNTSVAIGKYNENRTIYKRSNLFENDMTNRTVHLGIDLWAKSGTGVFAPMFGKVHSFKYNNNFGDFGPTIILQHSINNVVFYTLYGHLSLSSIKGLKIGKLFEAGEKIAEIGNYPINGNWPPHLHFQLITDMMGKQGDFYGVASIKECKKYLDLCPDPNLILNI